MLNKLLSLLFKANCPLCQRPANHILCQYCTQQLKAFQSKNPRVLWSSELPIFIWGKYDSYLKRAIASFKYELHQEIGELFGEWLAKSWLDSGFISLYQPVTVVPIPLYAKKQQERGFNQAEVIARRFCQITGYSLKANLLTRQRHTEAMFGLNPTQRQENIKDALIIGKKDYQRFNHKSSVLILDDIYTTGTTVKEATQVLRQSQIRVLGVAAIASPRL
jgi:ComF family protein